MEVAVAFVLLGLVAVISLVRLPGLWRGERHRELEHTLSWLPYGAGFRHGVIRSQPSLLAVLLLGLLAGASIAAADLSEGALITLFTVITISLLVTLQLCVVLALTIVLFNWPKLLVPPYLREQSGMVNDWFGRQANRR